MHPEQLRIYFDTSPAIRLFQAKHAPLIARFLFEQFKRHRAISRPHSELLPALAAYQEQLVDEGVEGLRDKPDEYLRDWSSPDKRWLLRFLEAGRDEPMYQLTPHSEAVLEFLERALQQDLAFVGTESRLRLVMQTLEELVVGASRDPQLRLQHLRTEQARLAEEIAEIERCGRVQTFAPTRIREQFALAVGVLKQLQGDFRAVEEKFKEITRQVQQRQVQGLDSRGGILGEALGAEDELKQQDQGVSFFEFVKFIQSPQQQDRLQDLIRQLQALRELADQTDGLATVRHMVRGLLDEAQQVLQTTRRLSSSLRRLLDERGRQERRRVTDLLRHIRVYAAALAEDPPRRLGAEIEDSLELAAPLSRTNWAPAAGFRQVDLTEHVVDEALRRDAFRRFQQLRPIDWNAMRRRIRLALERAGSCTLRDLLAAAPPAGLIDVLGYLQIACDDGHLVSTEASDELVLDSGESGKMSITVPHVTFVTRTTG